MVVAEYDPSAAVPVVPRPNDLALYRTGLVDVADAEGVPEAEVQFNRYLRTLDGFPSSATASCTFSGPLDPATVQAAARVLDVTDPSAPIELSSTASYEESKRRLKVTARFGRERSYAVALLAGAGGLKGAGGEEVVGAPTFSLLRAKKPLATCSDLAAADCRPTTSLISGESAEDERAKAVLLERARRALKPALDLLEKQGVPREQVAAGWVFSTHRMGLATFDPASKVVPFPNDLLMKDGRVNLPPDPADDLSAQQLKAALNALDGFSTSASLLTEGSEAKGAADVRLDGRSLDASQFRLVNLDNPSELVPVEVSCRSCGEGAKAPGSEPDQVALKPALPLRSHTRYAVLWLKGAQTLAGKPVNASPLFALSRLSAPLASGGKSTLDSLDDLFAVLLEPLRQKLQPALAAADRLSIPREEVLLAWTFTTQTTTELSQLRAKPQAWGLPSGLSGGPASLVAVDLSLLAQTSALIGRDVHSEIRWAKEGEFTSGNALDPLGSEVNLASGLSVPTDGAFTSSALASPRPEARRFILFVPKTARYPDGRTPLVFFHHGLGQSRRDSVAIANTAARAGYATLAIDAPFHGLRSYCQSSADCRAGTSCTGHRCPDTLADPNDGYRIRTIGTPLGPRPDPLETPDISGSQFSSSTNVFASRDHFRQQVIDYGQLIRVLEDKVSGLAAIDVDDPATSVVEKLEPSGPGYLGQSLGGIIGTLIAAAVPEIPASTLNVPGASMTDIMLTAPAFSSGKQAMDAYLAARGKPVGSQAYEQFLDIARWVLDPADPQSFGRHLIAEPLRDELAGAAGPRKKIFVQWIEGDQVVPNPTTRLLVRSVDAAPAPGNFRDKMYTGGSHAFLLDLFTSPGLALAAQAEAIQWIDDARSNP